jgi:hypothetical protein
MNLTTAKLLSRIKDEKFQEDVKHIVDELETKFGSPSDIYPTDDSVRIYWRQMGFCSKNRYILQLYVRKVPEIEPVIPYGTPKRPIQDSTPSVSGGGPNQEEHPDPLL